MFGRLWIRGIGKVESINNKEFSDTERVAYVRVEIRQRGHDGNDRTFYHTVECRGKAFSAAQTLNQGDMIAFNGSPRVTLYEKADGRPGYNFTTAGFIDRLSEDSDVPF